MHTIPREINNHIGLPAQDSTQSESFSDIQKKYRGNL